MYSGSTAVFFFLRDWFGFTWIFLISPTLQWTSSDHHHIFPLMNSYSIFNQFNQCVIIEDKYPSGTLVGYESNWTHKNIKIWTWICTRKKIHIKILFSVFLSLSFCVCVDDPAVDHLNVKIHLQLLHVYMVTLFCNTATFATEESFQLGIWWFESYWRLLENFGRTRFGLIQSKNHFYLMQ